MKITTRHCPESIVEHTVNYLYGHRRHAYTDGILFWRRAYRCPGDERYERPPTVEEQILEHVRAMRAVIEDDARERSVQELAKEVVGFDLYDDDRRNVLPAEEWTTDTGMNAKLDEWGYPKPAPHYPVNIYADEWFCSDCGEVVLVDADGVVHEDPDLNVG